MGGKHLIFFDGNCGLCNQSVRFVVAHDPRALFDFAPLEGKTAAQQLDPKWLKENTLVLLEHFGKPTQRLWVRGRGALRILWLLGGKWRLLGWMCFLPCGVDLVYRLIARHRRRVSLKKEKLPEERILP